MSFVSFAFAILFAVVFAARLTVGRRKTEPVYLGILLVASAVFYAWHIPAYLAIVVISTIVDFYAAREIHDCTAGLDGTKDEAAAARKRRKEMLWISLGLNLGVLAVFKYADFAIVEASALCESVGWNISLPHLRLALPMGISFYTFQSMSYTIDVYRGELKPLKSFWKFLLFVSFFPQLVAGPIVRATEFIYQLERRRRLTLRSFNEGGYLILRGLFLKMVCADNIGRYVDVHWQDAWSNSPNSSSLLLASVLFAFQIYGDFAGYSSIARGLAYWLGFRFPVNFNHPYLANSFSNFWQRWHITLSQWLRDYLYVPLGGNRVGKVRTYVNLMLVMVIGGLWHGASLTFVAWGTLHGVALAIERLLGLNRRKQTAVVRFAWFVVVQSTVLVTWVLFRSASFEEAWRLLSGIAAMRFGAIEFDAVLPCLCALPIVFAHVHAYWMEQKDERSGAVRTLSTQVPPRLTSLRPALVASGMLIAVLTCYAQSTDFMYFQF